MKTPNIVVGLSTFTQLFYNIYSKFQGQAKLLLSKS